MSTKDTLRIIIWISFCVVWGIFATVIGVDLGFNFITAIGILISTLLCPLDILIKTKK